MRLIVFTVFAATLLLLGLCNVEVNSKSNDVSAQKFTVNLSESELDAKDGVKEKVNLASSENIELVPEENLDGKERASLPELYQGFNPSDISRAELDELLALQKAARQLYKERLSDWRSQDKATRGPKPERGAVAASEEDEKRLRSLNAKLWIAINRKNYERYGKDFVSSEEIDEIIALEKQESQSLLNRKNKYRSELENWEIQDPVIRGEKPSMDKPLFTGSSPRAMELKEKIYRVEEISRLRRRLRNISPSDNVLLLDSDITEWSELRQERSKLEIDLAKTIQAVQSDKQFQTSGDIKESEVVEEVIKDVFPKHKLKRMFQIEKRIYAIEAPLKAAETADRTRKNMSKLSEQSGVSVTSREIQEAIDLKVELDRIKIRAEFEVTEKLVEEGEFPPKNRPPINSKDAARIKEINARIKEISAPMDEALSALK